MTNHLALLPTPPEPQPPAQGTVAQPVLPLERDHDLPPLWDDNSVTWHGWNPAPPPTTWELHHHTCPELCEACGSTTPQTINRGTVRTPGPRTAGTTTTHPGKIRGTLIAMRCPDCLLDTVVDLTTPEGDVWILDEADYHDAGSHNPQETP